MCSFFAVSLIASFTLLAHDVEDLTDFTSPHDQTLISPEELILLPQEDLDNSAQVEEFVEPLEEEIVASEDLSFFPESSSLSPSPEMPSLPEALPKKSSFWALSLNALAPGLGHYYLKQPETATPLLSTFLASEAAFIASARNLDRFEDLVAPTSIVVSTTVFYSWYATYRDVRLYNHNDGYKYSMPTDSFKDLVWAPFNPAVLKKKEVWSGILGGLAAAFAVTQLEDHFLSLPKLSLMGDWLSPSIAFPVGIGEEAFFRGFLQSILSEPLTPTGSIITSSLLFGAAHIPNASLMNKEERLKYFQISIPFIASLGGYFGWLTHKNTSLKESVAVHAWYDFVLFALSAWDIYHDRDNKVASSDRSVAPTSFQLVLPF
jgi:membrane protease YdiL (CAAX protease family)